MTEHLSRHELEQVIESETRSGPHASTRRELQARSHVLSCDVCMTRKRSVETARARFLELAPAAPFAAATLARAANAPQPASTSGGFFMRAGAWALGGVVVAVAAAALLWLRPAPSGDTIRLKGTAALEVFVKRGERALPVVDGARLAGGDQLGFVYTLSEPRHLLLLGVDESGAITRYFPAEGTAAAPLPSGSRVQLQLGVQLDDRRGQERLIALFDEAPLDEAAARRALTAQLEHARQQGRGLSSLERLELPVQQAGIWFEKP